MSQELLNPFAVNTTPEVPMVYPESGLVPSEPNAIDVRLTVQPSEGLVRKELGKDYGVVQTKINWHMDGMHRLNNSQQQVLSKIPAIEQAAAEACEWEDDKLAATEADIDAEISRLEEERQRAKNMNIARKADITTQVRDAVEAAEGAVARTTHVSSGTNDLIQTEVQAAGECNGLMAKSSEILKAIEQQNNALTGLDAHIMFNKSLLPILRDRVVSAQEALQRYARQNGGGGMTENPELQSADLAAADAENKPVFTGEDQDDDAEFGNQPHAVQLPGQKPVEAYTDGVTQVHESLELHDDQLETLKTVYNAAIEELKTLSDALNHQYGWRRTVEEKISSLRATAEELYTDRRADFNNRYTRLLIPEIENVDGQIENALSEMDDTDSALDDLIEQINARPEDVTEDDTQDRSFDQKRNLIVSVSKSGGRKGWADSPLMRLINKAYNL